MTLDWDDQVMPCGCVLDDDPDTVGVLFAACAEHAASELDHYRVWQLLAAELDSVVLGRGTRAASDRKQGAVFGSFPIARRK